MVPYYAQEFCRYKTPREHKLLVGRHYSINSDPSISRSKQLGSYLLALRARRGFRRISFGLMTLEIPYGESVAVGSQGCVGGGTVGVLVWVAVGGSGEGVIVAVGVSVPVGTGVKVFVSGGLVGLGVLVGVLVGVVDGLIVGVILDVGVKVTVVSGVGDSVSVGFAAGSPIVASACVGVNAIVGVSVGETTGAGGSRRSIFSKKPDALPTMIKMLNTAVPESKITGSGRIFSFRSWTTGFFPCSIFL